MIRKFATVPGIRVVLTAITFLTILAGAPAVRAQQPPPQTSPAQQPPAQQQADNQQSSGQETSPEETMSRRKLKPREYKNWNFNVGGGAATYSGATRNFVRGGGIIGAAGVARNYSKYFGFRADFQFDNLPLRSSALEAAQAPGANSHVYTLMIDPIITLPVTKVWSGYIVFGPSYYHRSGKLDSSTAIPGSACNAFFTWWGRCFAGSLPLDGRFLTSSQNEFGENFGGGIARKINANVEIYGEYRLMHGTHNRITTDVRPITIGVRW
jgi:Outer membrane protein beta-barrel domain